MRSFGFAVGDAVGNSRGAEAAEDHGMHGADAGAGEHRDGQLGDHGHIDRNAIARLDAKREEHVGELADALVQFGESVLDVEPSSASHMSAGLLAFFSR